MLRCGDSHHWIKLRQTAKEITQSMKSKCHQNVRLLGYPGLKLKELRAKLDEELPRNGTGNVVLHLGGNDIGAMKEKAWKLELEIHLAFIKVQFPGYNVFWSDMTPRGDWRGKNAVQMEKKRKRSNIRARNLFYEEGDGVIHHPILQTDPSMLDDDIIHYSPWGGLTFWNDFANFFNFLILMYIIWLCCLFGVKSVYILKKKKSRLFYVA